MGCHRFHIPSNHPRFKKLAIGRWRVGMEGMQNMLESMVCILEFTFTTSDQDLEGVLSMGLCG